MCFSVEIFRVKSQATAMGKMSSPIDRRFTENKDKPMLERRLVTFTPRMLVTAMPASIQTGSGSLNRNGNDRHMTPMPR